MIHLNNLLGVRDSETQLQRKTRKTTMMHMANLASFGCMCFTPFR